MKYSAVKATLHYGYQETECGIFHAFELTDQFDNADEELMGKNLAELLDTTPDDDRFNFDCMDVAIPEKTLERSIREKLRRFAVDFAKENDFAVDDPTAKEQLRAVVTTICLMQEIDVDTRAWDMLIDELWEAVSLEESGQEPPSGKTARSWEDRHDFDLFMGEHLC